MITLANWYFSAHTVDVDETDRPDMWTENRKMSLARICYRCKLRQKADDERTTNSLKSRIHESNMRNGSYQIH